MTVRGAVAALLLIACASDPLDGDDALPGAAGAGGDAMLEDAGAAGEGATPAAAGAGGAGGAASSGCPLAGEPTVVGSLAPAIYEASGLAASRRFPGVLYTHRDSGAGPRGYALTEGGLLIAALDLSGALAQDWEDMGIGPGPDAGESYLYFADIGDNDLARNVVVVHRAIEPELDVDARDQVIELDFSSLYFEYPDGSHDAETLFIDPDSADLYIVTKAVRGSDVYLARAPHSTTEIGELEHVTALALPTAELATGGDMAADGSLILIRSYNNVFAWPHSASESVGETLGREPCELSAPPEMQGEAIAISRDASAYFTASEGSGTPIFRVDLQ